MESSFVLDVDGERFSVTGKQGEYLYIWLSGKNPGYGFGSSHSRGGSLTEAEHVDSIRDFLSGIDPETGYLSE